MPVKQTAEGEAFCKRCNMDTSTTMPEQNSRDSEPDHEIARTLVLSTGHITRKDGDLLDQDTDPVESFQKAIGAGASDYDAFGYWVWVPDDSDATFVASTTTIEQAGFSQAFVDLLHLARRLGCQWLMLDRDGPLRSDLPRFEW